MMHLGIMLYTYWTPLHKHAQKYAQLQWKTHKIQNPKFFLAIFMCLARLVSTSV